MVADATKKEIVKCYKFLVENVKVKVERVTPASLVRRFCAALGLGAREAKAAEEMARAAVPSEDGGRLAELRALCVYRNLAPALRAQRWRFHRDMLIVRRVLQEVPVVLSPLRPQWWEEPECSPHRAAAGDPCLTFVSCRLTNAPLRPWDGKSPASVAAAVIYAISSLAGQPSSAGEVAQVSHTSSPPVERHELLMCHTWGSRPPACVGQS